MPHRIVVGGGVLNIPGLIDAVREATAARLVKAPRPRCRPRPASTTTSVRPGLGTFSGVLGALGLGRTRVPAGPREPRRPADRAATTRGVPMPVLRPLHAEWTCARRRAGPAPPTAVPSRATVPGCVHTDLLAAGLIPDPYLDDNETRLAWIGRTDWVYETTFDCRPDGARAGRPGLRRAGHGRHDRRSTAARSAAPRNMHRGYRFDVRGAAARGRQPPGGPFDSAYALRRGAAGRGSATRPNAYAEPFHVHPQDGLQLRLGLGTDPGHRRDLAADRPGALVGGPARRGPPAGHRRRRRRAGSRCTSTARAGRRRRR